jgi:hypothetical protein
MRLVEAGHATNVVTISAFWVSVPVLSEHRTSVVPASSTAERRVGRTPSFAKDRAPSAAATVKVAGSATGIDARTAVKTRGTISPKPLVALGNAACQYEISATPIERAQPNHFQQCRPRSRPQYA